MKKVIEVSHFTKTFGKKTAVDNLSFEVYKGEVFALLGSNGSGKTTTIRCLLDIHKPSSGSLKIFGKKYSQSLASQIGYLPEERGLYTSSKALETLIYFGQLKNMGANEAEKSAREYLNRVKLWEKREQQIKSLSSGEQQKIQLGLAIINKPNLLILDEPTKGLDPVNRSLLMEELFELNKSGSTIIFITHQMQEVEKIADRLLMIKNGQNILYGKVNEIRQNFGKNVISISTKDRIPQNKRLYEIKKTKNSTKLLPKNDKSSQDILKYLVNNNIQINSFSHQSSSLEEIFISVSK